MAVSGYPWLHLIAIAIAGSFSVVFSDELALFVGQSNVLEIVPSFPVRDSPGSKPGSVVGAERVHIYGLPRMMNLKRLSNAVKVKVSYSNSSLRQPNVEVCFHK
ncbi:hypothetical protein Dimus_014225 [Dionaea muscipula]